MMQRGAGGDLNFGPHRRGSVARRTLLGSALGLATAVIATASVAAPRHLLEGRRRNMTQPDSTGMSTDTASLLDRMGAIEAVHAERASRDEADWTVFASLIEPDAKVEVSWFRGSGDEFVRMSRQQTDAGLRVLHHLTTTRALVVKDRAVVRAACIITTITPMRVGDVDVSITADTRLHYRLRRTDGRWRISGLTAVYLKDTVSPRALGQPLNFDAKRLSSARASYRHLTYLMAERGVEVPQDLAGIDRPETVAPVVAADEAWLAGG
jgi:hypothetical protein